MNSHCLAEILAVIVLSASAAAAQSIRIEPSELNFAIELGGTTPGSQTVAVLNFPGPFSVGVKTEAGGPVAEVRRGARNRSVVGSRPQ